MRSISTTTGIIGAAVALAIVVLMVFGASELRNLYPHAMPGEQLVALAAVLGGALGAVGAAGAVYLTLSAQRRDDVEKFIAAARMEVVELGRTAVGHLASAVEMYLENSRVPVGDLPAIFRTPEAVVYRVIADRLGRLPRPTLWVSLHARISEAQTLAALLAVGKTSVAVPGLPAPPVFVDKANAKLLAESWFDICGIARAIIQLPAKEDSYQAYICNDMLSHIDHEMDEAATTLQRNLDQEPVPSGPGETTMSDEGKAMQPEHVIKKVVWRGVVSIGSTMEKATTWSITGIAAITALLLSNLHSLSTIVAIGKVRTVVILFTISLVTGAASKVIGMATTAGLKAVRELEETFGAEQHQNLMRQMSTTPQEFVREVAEPFLWPLSVLMRRSGERGSSDYLSADKKFVRLFCVQLYLNALHGLSAVVALLVLAFSM